MFLAAIVLPIVGNATEHACAIIFAMKGRLDLSIGITVGILFDIYLYYLYIYITI